jgi:hypothetical protein
MFLQKVCVQLYVGFIALHPKHHLHQAMVTTFHIHSRERTSLIQNCVHPEMYVDVEKYDLDITAGYFTTAALQFPMHNHFPTPERTTDSHQLKLLIVVLA